MFSYKFTKSRTDFYILTYILMHKWTHKWTNVWYIHISIFQDSNTQQEIESEA